MKRPSFISATNLRLPTKSRGHLAGGQLRELL